MRHINLIQLLAVALGFVYSTSELSAQSSNEVNSVSQTEYPEFSWDYIPKYMHIRKATAYTPDEIKFLSKFPLITFEKFNGHKSYGSAEEGTLISARAVKKINPKAKILYYRNVIVHYDNYAANKELDGIPDALLQDAAGNENLVRDTVPAYDLSNAKLRDWWVESCKEMTADPAIDGIFLDGNIKALEPAYLKRAIGVDKKKETMEGYHQMMKETREAIGPKELMLSNIIRARFKDGGLEYLDYFDGSYLEGFFHTVGKISREEYVAKGIESMQKAARQGKIIAFTTGFHTGINNSKMGIDESHSKIGSHEEARKAFSYPLGIFLVCAEKYSYFRVHEGYSADRDDRWMRYFDEYDRPLGAPKGPAVKVGYIYTREFEHASVKLDIMKQVADIKWDKPSNKKN